jgi:hypothetical protein
MDWAKNAADLRAAVLKDSSVRAMKEKRLARLPARFAGRKCSLLIVEKNAYIME